MNNRKKMEEEDESIESMPKMATVRRSKMSSFTVARDDGVYLMDRCMNKLKSDRDHNGCFGYKFLNIFKLISEDYKKLKNTYNH
jgi:hypothetical protein